MTLAEQLAANALARAAVVNIERLPQPVNLNIYAGDDVQFALVITEGSSGNPVDLAGVQVKSQVRATAAAPEVLATIVPDIEDNVIRMHLTSAESAALPQRAVWDCQVDTAGLITTLVGGTVTVTPRVTRWGGA